MVESSSEGRKIHSSGGDEVSARRNIFQKESAVFIRRHETDQLVTGSRERRICDGHNRHADADRR